MSQLNCIFSKLFFLKLLCLSLCLASNQSLAQVAHPATQLNFKILSERSHKPQSFTQGFEVHKGVFIESSGLYAKSFIAEYPVQEPASSWAKLTAPYSKKQPLGEQFFAEGLTLFNDKIYLLTWKENTLFVFDAKDFKCINTLKYEGEGWGLTHDEKFLIRSDGSDKIYFHDTNNFKIEKTLHVIFNQVVIQSINELEYVNGFIYANVWHDNHILKIDAKTGLVTAYLDLSNLVESLHLSDSESVLNGIAYDEDKKAFWITGKQWPKMFLIEMF